MYKCLEGISIFILEDFAQVGLQYFYHEKYTFLENDVLVYVNVLFMVAKAIFFSVEIIVVSQKTYKWLKSAAEISRIEHLRQTAEKTRLEGYLLFFFAIFLNAYPISRAAGTFYQAERGDGMVRVSKLNQIKK